jgi:predicted xylose isomerase-like sugar epimerase
LRRNTRAIEVPDQRYWTAYDRYMIEREARAMRNAQLQALLARGFRGLVRKLFG